MTIEILANDVGDDLNRTDLTAQCSAAVMMAIRHYDQRRWWFNEGSATFTATATSTYNLPTDFRGMDYAEVRLSGGTRSRLRERDFATVKQLLEATSNGDPSVYALYDNDIWLYQFPDGTANGRVVTLYYIKNLAAITASGSNIWTGENQHLIRAAAAKTVALRTMHDPDLAAFFAQIEHDLLNTLIGENERRVTTGFSTPRY